MSREDIQKLLGGYATGTLTPEEQQLLFEAALEDQELFDALAREQSLRDLLRDPAARAHLLTALNEQPAPWYRSFWRKPVMLGAVAVALSLVAIVVVRQSRRPEPVAVARVEKPAPPAPLPPPPADKLEVAPTPVAPHQPAPPKRQASDTFGNRRSVPQVARDDKPVAPPAAAAAPPVVASQQVQVLAGASPVFGVTDAVKKAEVEKLKDLPTDRKEIDAIPQPQSQVITTGQLQQLQQGMKTVQQQNFLQAGSGGVQAGFAGGVIGGILPLAIHYRVLQDLPGGGRAEVNPDRVPRNATLRLEVTPHQSGFLRIQEVQPDGSTREILNRAVEPMTPVETPLPPMTAAGQRSWNIALTRTPVGDLSKQEATSEAKKDSGAVADGGGGGRGGRAATLAAPLMMARKSADVAEQPPKGQVATARDASSPSVMVVLTLNVR